MERSQIFSPFERRAREKATTRAHGVFVPRFLLSGPNQRTATTTNNRNNRQEMVADKTRQGLWAVGSDNFPGSLLIRLGLGRDVVARHNPWEEMLTLAQVPVHEVLYTYSCAWFASQQVLAWSQTVLSSSGGLEDALFWQTLGCLLALMLGSCCCHTTCPYVVNVVAFFPFAKDKPVHPLIAMHTLCVPTLSLN